jgi:DNA-binding NtrC family response regulator
VEHFLKKLEETHGGRKTVSDEVLACLMQYSWPGTVRQLESVLERSYIMCEAGTIGMENVPAEVRQYTEPRASIDGITSRLDELINAKLTAAEYRLYLYLTKLDPGMGVVTISSSRKR